MVNVLKFLQQMQPILLLLLVKMVFFNLYFLLILIYCIGYTYNGTTCIKKTETIETMCPDGFSYVSSLSTCVEYCKLDLNLHCLTCSASIMIFY